MKQPKDQKAQPKTVRNKSNLPDNIVRKNNQIMTQCKEIEQSLPSFLRDYCLYIKNAVAVSSRLAYLSDLRFFLHYLISEHPDFQEFSSIQEITLDRFQSLKARDINYFIGEYCARYETESAIVENHNRSLARKRSSLSVMFKYLFRDELMDSNLVDGFNPIKLPKPQPDSIKKLEIEEVRRMLEIVETGKDLTEKERVFWEKTKLRDKAILVLFITYGLRVSELQQLDLDSIHYARNDFRIFRKRGKEVRMPLNHSALTCLRDYIERERPESIDTDDPLFLSLQRKRMTVRSIRDLVVKYTSLAMEKPRNSGYSPHKLRATAASSLIEYGFSIYDVQNLLDHENVTTTQLYAAHRRNSKRDLIRQYEVLDGSQEMSTAKISPDDPLDK